MDSESCLNRFITSQADNSSKLSQLQKFISYCIEIQRPPQFKQDLPLQTIFYEPKTSYQRICVDEEIFIPQKDVSYLVEINKGFVRQVCIDFENKQDDVIFQNYIYLSNLQ